MVKPFEGGDVSLEEDILKKEVKFVKNWVQWAADNELRVAKFVQITGPGSPALYTVPANRTLYITQCSLSADHGTGDGRMEISKSAGAFARVRLLAVEHTGTMCCNFSMPVKVESGEVVSITVTGAGQSLWASFIGFEVARSI